MAFSAVAALAAAETVTAGMVLAAVSEVGIAMTVVGAVTGEKELMKIGGTLSVVGGVGGFVNSAINSAANVAIDGVATTVADEAAAKVGADQFASTMSNFEASPTSFEGFGKAIESGVSGQDALAVQNTPGNQSLDLANQSANSQAAAPALGNADINTPAGTAMPSVNTPASTGTPMDAGSAYGNNPSAYNPTTGQTNIRNLMINPVNKVDSTSWLDSIGSWLKDTMSKPGNIGGAMQGAAKAYEANRNYDLAKQRQGLIAQNMANQSAISNFKYGA